MLVSHNRAILSEGDMPRELVLQDGVLSAVVKSFEPVELAQIEAELKDREEQVNVALLDLGNVPVDENEQLVAAAKQHAEAKVALEDSKSELQVAQGLVAQLPAPSEPEEVDGDQESGTSEF
jgi:hypothetical protein